MRLLAAALILVASAACGDTEEAGANATGQRTDRVTAEACAAVGWTVVETDGGIECHPPTVESEEDCEALGGEAYRLGLDSDPATCFLPTPDAGLPCTDGQECAGFCEAPADAEPGATANGTCSARTQEVCWTPINGGIVSGTICY